MNNGFRHEALFYSSDAEFISGTLPFVTAGCEAGEQVLVAARRERLDLLRLALEGHDRTGACDFLEFDELGRNPARIIPAWRRFYEEHGGPGRRIRGIGEPLWADRSRAELEECRRHEALLNLAFADADGFWLRCPYDRSALGPEVLAAACCTHPHLAEDGGDSDSESYPGDELTRNPFAGGLSPPGGDAEVLPFAAGELKAVRSFALSQAKASGLPVGRAEDMALAVSELAANSIRHSGGGGTARAWRESGELICEVEDGGRIEDPLAGRRTPSAEQISGRGLWLVNQLSDLLEIRSQATGTLARVHMRVVDQSPQLSLN